MSLNIENNCHEILEDKIAVCEKTAGLWNGNFLELNSACSVKIIPFQDMGNESERYRDAANGLHEVFLITPTRLSLIHLNIRSLGRNFNSLTNLLVSINHTFSVIGISETWLQIHCTSSILLDTISYMTTVLIDQVEVLAYI
jgi:hypothetical protein